MLRKILLGLVLGCVIGGAQAQTPSPANVGVVKGTPDVFKLLDHSGAWSTFGSVDPTTHVFTPTGGGGGSLTVNGSAGVNNMTFVGSGVSVSGTSPNATVTIPGGGGGGGHQLPFLNVLDYGFVSGGTDNQPFISTLMNGIYPVDTVNSRGGYDVYFPPVPGQETTDYYFSDSFNITRESSFRCGGAATDGGAGSTRLIFPAGVDGVVFKSAFMAADGGWGGGELSGCEIYSLGVGQGVAAASSNTVTGVSMVSTGDAGIPSTTWHVGDGIVLINRWLPYNGAPAVPPGAYVSAVSGGPIYTLTLASGFGTNPVTTFDSNPTAHTTMQMWQLPATKKFTFQVATGSSILTVTAGPRPMKIGDVLWSDAFIGGTSVLDINGITFPQTVTVGNIIGIASSVTSSKTYTSGSPGQLWIIPAALERRVAAKSDKVIMNGFGFGIKMDCGLQGTLHTGCNDSLDIGDTIHFSLIGRLARGEIYRSQHFVAEMYANGQIIS